jgi:hypothetical protein
MAAIGFVLANDSVGCRAGSLNLTSFGVTAGSGDPALQDRTGRSRRIACKQAPPCIDTALHPGFGWTSGPPPLDMPGEWT